MTTINTTLYILCNHPSNVPCTCSNLIMIQLNKKDECSIRQDTEIDLKIIAKSVKNK